MKRINKSTPAFFSDYLKNNSPSEWSVLSSEIGQEIRNYILEREQNNQCAYTEVAIDADVRRSHIDHYKKRALFRSDTFNWNNLVVSCNSESYGAKYKDKQVRSADYQNLINPTVENPSDFFDYSFTGILKEKDLSDTAKIKAITTIDLFGLNNNSLVERRATIIDQVRSYAAQLSLEEVKLAIGEFDSLVESIYSALRELS